jgi:hypothetical protein
MTCTPVTVAIPFRQGTAEVVTGTYALAVEINCFRHTYNTLRPHQALNDWTPRHVYLTSPESQ